MSPRVSVQLPARYSIPRLGLTRLRARTLNMSRSGALIECLDEPAGMNFGDTVEIEIDLPVINTVQARCIYSTGHIVRMERAGSVQRIALALEAMEFRDAAITAVAICGHDSSFVM
jgi:hypothetical protein